MLSDSGDKGLHRYGKEERDRGHTCLVPLVTGKLSDRRPFNLSLAVGLAYSSLIWAMNVGLRPSLAKTAKR